MLYVCSVYYILCSTEPKVTWRAMLEHRAQKSQMTAQHFLKKALHSNTTQKEPISFGKLSYSRALTIVDDSTSLISVVQKVNINNKFIKSL